MTRFEYFRRLSPSGTLKLGEVAKIVDALRRGGLAILPTETGYMLAVSVTNLDAVKNAFAVKGRDWSNPMHIACSSLEMAELYSVISLTAMRLLGTLTPGPISVIVNQTARLPKKFVTLNNTVGIRIPDHPATLQIIASLGEPVTATSLNESGSSRISIDESELEHLNWPDREVVPVVDAGDSIPYPLASTLVRVTGPSVEILRSGPISDATVHEVAGRMSYLDVAD